ncbi:3-hydroxyacyl-CoA dehydrogenase NAD-binding domain-containing protein [Accumulibacter sp.]|uniref:3-hydroxyacyl-CoA dehydrogenase NAD-binding domain-containing protein n=1 Tax=Accumulibacter sp. TaxID=2053492 RepID=UPI0025EA3229|nr:3-hydroxyacyl-CoA dehydrogenase NAD-binding domain-containing protein [Accumulibacter sp.]MCM8595469.1 3-hydroxyacyl-CoA dehydrogenase NAD-binding domain-containing protein [Accumulibacter sp.]MCM8626352.1 3-hydroxyacyl-CoA dehydrogenase NAD-binding domain-containing protein [Accumulibacter sp.]MDS4049616.1 3-hydroxyacyl-CoA dehydrogenase NAD-binding domain-containing protein [Accumulibacter sp.]
MHMKDRIYTNWRCEIGADGLAWVTLDKPGESTNSLSSSVIDELARLLDDFESQPPKAVIFRSGKAAGFIAGADIGEFSGLDTAEKGIELVGRGWHLFNRLASVSYPTLALVRGHCLGGGLELALACRHLLVVDEPSTRLGLPEVMLGIFPGWGGMLRLPERIGPQAALDLMLTGRTIDARKAKRLGLADECVPPRVMDSAAAQLVSSGQARRRLPLLQRLLDGPGRALVASGARKQVARRARIEHYPAPYAIIDIWERHRGNALAAPELIDGIVRSPTARNLVRVFFLQERLKAFGKGSSFEAKRVHVVGAGVMGGDIAAWCAQRGLTVTLQDQGIERIAPALKRAYSVWGQRIRDERERRALIDRLIPDPEGHGARIADVVIEAISEDLEAKRALLARLDGEIRPDAVLATNTSSLSIEELSPVLARPERLVGIHFFNPVARMPLVEVVSAEGTDPEMTQRSLAFVRQIDRLPLPVRSAPGFLVNAVLGPYMLEAMRAVDDGIAPETVDEAMRAFGMPMGPIELVDMVGLDVAMAAGRSLAGKTAEPPRCLAERFAAGHLGKKSGKGFYDYTSGRANKAAAGAIPAGLAERLVRPLLERTQQLVDRGIVADTDLADAGVIFGTGFAPFTGGPLNYLRSQHG